MRHIILLAGLWLSLINTAQSADGEIWKYVKTASPATISQMLSDSLGNTYVLGSFNSPDFTVDEVTVPGSSTGDSYSTFIMKRSSTGRLIWLYSVYCPVEFGGEVYPNRIAINENGELVANISANGSQLIRIGDQVITVETSQNSPLLIKFSKTGRLEWYYSLRSQNSDSSYASMQLSDMVLDETGNCYFSGYYQGDRAIISSSTGAAGAEIAGLRSYDLSYLGRVDATGELGWFRTLADRYDSGNGSMQTENIRFSPDNSLYITGHYAGSRVYIVGNDSLAPMYGDEAFLARFHTNGAPDWAMRIAGDASEYLMDLKTFPDQGVLITFATNGYYLYYDDLAYSNFIMGYYQLHLARIASDKRVEAHTRIATDLSVSQLNTKLITSQACPDGKVYLSAPFTGSSIFDAPNTLTNADAGTTDLLLAQLDPATLDPLWSQSAKGIDDVEAEQVNIDKKGNIFIGGTTYTDLELAAEPITSPTLNGTMYCARITPEGNLGYAYWHENLTNAVLYAQSIGSDAYGNCFLAGSFTGNEALLDDLPVTRSESRGLFFGKYARSRTINGEVQLENGSAFQDGYVKIYGYTYYQQSPLNDSVPLNTGGSFTFVDIPNGNYLIVVIPTGEAATQLINTYYPSAEYWEFASRIRITPGVEPAPIQIIMRAPTPLIGGTELNGNFSEKEYDTALASKRLEKAKPETEATVVIAGNRRYEKTSYQIVATTTTDQNGDFAFYNIENGTYNLWIDYPGLPCEPIYVIAVNNNQIISNINYLSTEEIIEPEGLVNYNSLLNNTPASGIRLFPNPASEYIILDIENFNQGVADIYNSSGKHIAHYTLEQAQQMLPVNNLKSGQYFVRIRTEDKLVFETFIRTE